MILFNFFRSYYFSIFSLFKSKKTPKVESLFTNALNALLNGDKSKAISLLQQVVKKDTSHVRAYLQLGNILRKENTDQAIKIHQSLTVRPNLGSDQKVEIHKALKQRLYRNRLYKECNRGSQKNITN